MKFLDKLYKYSQRISFNIFAFNGYIIFFIFVYWNFLVEPDYSYVSLLFIINAFIISIFLIAFIAYSIEVVTQYKIPFAFLKNRRYSFISLFGAIISTIYLLLLIMFFVLPLFM